MTREQTRRIRIQKIRKRISDLDRLIERQFQKLGNSHVSRTTERLEDRRDLWESRLVTAELTW